MMNSHEFFRKAAEGRAEQLNDLMGTLIVGVRGPIVQDTFLPVTKANPLKPLYELARYYHIQN